MPAIVEFPTIVKEALAQVLKFSGQIPKLLLLVHFLWFRASFPGAQAPAESGFQVLDEGPRAARAAGHCLATDGGDGAVVFAAEVRRPVRHRPWHHSCSVGGGGGCGGGKGVSPGQPYCRLYSVVRGKTMDLRLLALSGVEGTIHGLRFVRRRRNPCRRRQA